ncbi:restriction endonuclease subunit S [Streptomyces hygroscopicus]|nr:restriction endonuclease subunit S [Streptomyces hygroscopicus]
MNVTREGELDLADARYVVDDSDRRVTRGDILFNNTNSPTLVGKTAFFHLKQSAAYSNHMTRLRPPLGIVPKFLATQLHWLWMSGYFREVLNNHVNQASVATKKLLETPIAIPPTAEQHRIVEALEDHISHLDAASQSLAHAQALAPLCRRALYTAATEGTLEIGGDDFVPDFLELRRECWRSTQSKKYKDPVSPDPAYIPQLPPNWRVYSLEALTNPIRIIRYGILMPKVKSGGTIPYVEVKDLKDCTLHGKELHLTSEDLDEQFAGARIRPGDVLIAVRGSYDRSAVVPPGLKGANVSRDVARISPLPGIDPEYLHLYLQSSFAQRYLKAHARGVAVKGVNIASIRALPVSVPPPSTQKRIVQKVQQRLTAIEAAAKAVDLSIARSAALRRGLLNRAFTGHLVPQDPTDEPASVLLDRIRAEREAESRSGKGKARRAPRRPHKATTTDAAPPPPPPAASIPAPTNAVQQELPL